MNTTTTTLIADRILEQAIARLPEDATFAEVQQHYDADLEFILQSINLQARIFEENYYTAIYYAALSQCRMHASDLYCAIYTVEQLTSLWHMFWRMLPDNEAIHREPFNQLCNLYEGPDYTPEGD